MKRTLLYFLFFLFSFQASAQQPTKEELQEKNKELINDMQIISLNLADTKKQKKATYGSWLQIRNKIDMREKVIDNIKGEVYYIEKDISHTYKEIDTMKKEMDTLRAQYAKSIVYAYKNRSNYDFLNFIFSANSFNDAIKRLQYLKTYRQYREQQAGEIKKTKQLLENKIASLTGKRVDKSTALLEQNKQMSALEQDKQQKDKVLADLNTKEGELARTMKNREAQRSKINSRIKQIIKDEIAAAKKEADRQEKVRRAEIERRAAIASAEALATKKAEELRIKQEIIDNKHTTASTTTTKPTPSVEPVVKSKPLPSRTVSVLDQTPEALIVSTDFIKNKGGLPWPVSQGQITLHFGKNSIPAKPRPIEIQEDGITIETTIGAPVKSIFEGVVSQVFNVGDGVDVIIRHGKFYSNYSGLSSAIVTKGTVVTRGQIIGQAGANDDGVGNIELTIFNEKENLNPEQWIKRR